MAKVVGPLLSLGAAGAIAETLVFSSWKGIQYAKKYIIPANPKSAAQQTQRGHFEAAVDNWHDTAYTGADKVSWDRRSGLLGKAMSGFNNMISECIKALIAGDTWYQLRDLDYSAVGATTLDAYVKEKNNVATLTIHLYVGVNPNFLLDQGLMVWNAGTTRYELQAAGLVSKTIYYVEVRSIGAGEAGILGVDRRKTT